MKREGIQSQRGYRKPRPKGGVENIIVSNKLAREFNPHAPNQARVTDITYIKIHEGWLYLKKKKKKKKRLLWICFLDG